MKLGLLICGDTGYNALEMLIKKYEIVFVLTDKKSSSIINFCQKKSISYYDKNPRLHEVSNVINGKIIDVLLSVNYIYIIEKNLIKLPQKVAVNIHGSLLPKYKGRSPNVWAIINNEKITGVTSHLIEEECDSGDIIEQITVKIEENDSGGDLLHKLLDQYPVIINNTLEKIENNNIHLTKQEHIKATYFGKRTPLDGHIQWFWQKERIYNWVRAQAKPYPGAFCIIENKKIIVHKIVFSDLGFNYLTDDGTIVKTQENSFYVKTPNGVVEVVDYENNENASIKENILLK